MKVTVKEKESDITYPCLMIEGDGVIVLFRSYGCGMALVDGGVWRQGEYSDTCEMDMFTSFTGTITLSND